MINTSDKTVRTTSDILTADSWKGDGARPATISIPPGKTVHVDDGYALKRSSGRVNADGEPVLLPSAVEQLAPQLQPADEAAKTMFATKTVDDLDHVKRAYAEAAKEGKAGPGTIEEAMVAHKIEAGIRKGMAAALGVGQPKPEAVPVFGDDDANTST
jgi:hypothetical protein